MKKLRELFKYNKIVVVILVIIGFITCFSFFQYFNDYYSNSQFFENKKETCLIDKNKNDKFCSSFPNEKELKNYLEDNDPRNKFKKLDAITLTCEIVENGLFSVMQLLAPILIIIAVIGSIHKYFNSGMFKNYLTRMRYKDYLKVQFIKILKISFIIPVSLLFIFILSCLITKFNFKVDEKVKQIAVYSDWKYNNFILYGAIICLLQYIMSIMYGLLGLINCLKNKNSVIACVLSYIFFLIEYLFIYIVLYSIIVKKIFNINGLAEYFNISGYWFFNDKMNYGLLLLISFLIVLCNFIIIYKKIYNKEKVVMENEKQIA